MKDRNSPHLMLTLGHLYPDQLNLYGDRGNILVLRQRCQQRGIKLRVVSLGIGDALAPDEYDMLFIGGGQDREQAHLAQDLHETKGIGLWAAIEDDMPVLAVCGGYQLLAHYYRPASGPDMRGLGVFDAWTIHKGPRVARCMEISPSAGMGVRWLVLRIMEVVRIWELLNPWEKYSRAMAIMQKMLQKGLSIAMPMERTCMVRSCQKIRISPTI